MDWRERKCPRNCRVPSFLQAVAESSITDIDHFAPRTSRLPLWKLTGLIGAASHCATVSLEDRTGSVLSSLRQEKKHAHKSQVSDVKVQAQKKNEMARDCTYGPLSRTGRETAVRPFRFFTGTSLERTPRNARSVNAVWLGDSQDASQNLWAV